MIEIVHTRMGILTYLAPSGSIADQGGLAALRETVEKCLRGREFNLVLDLGRVPTLTGEVLEALLDFQDQLARLGGGLKVMNAHALVKDIFAVTGFNRFVEVMDETVSRNQ